MSKEDGKDSETPTKMLMTKTASRWCLFSCKVHKVKYMKKISTTIAISVCGKEMIIAKNYQLLLRKLNHFRISEGNWNLYQRYIQTFINCNFSFTTEKYKETKQSAAKKCKHNTVVPPYPPIQYLQFAVPWKKKVENK
jgi:hypothetical protein